MWSQIRPSKFDLILIMVHNIFAIGCMYKKCYKTSYLIWVNTGTLKEIMMQITQLKSTWNYIIWQAGSRTINCKYLIKLFNYYTLILIYLCTNLSAILNLFETSFSKCWKIVTLQFYCDAENLYLYSSLKIL